MIKEIDIVGFQSHKNTQLELDPGVNVIVGATDSGKSAIIRALRWLIMNRPIGDGFISHWSEGAYVNILTGDTDVIQRAKGPSGNQYRINDEIFNAIGNDVPQPVQELLNMDETNIQRQGDPYFLISRSPGEVASYFNNVAKLGKIDSSLKFITSQAKALSGQIKSAEVRLQSLEADAKRYEYLEQAEARLEVLEEDSKKQRQRITGLRSLQELIAEISLVEIDLGVDETIVSLEDAANTLQEMYDGRKTAELERGTLEHDLVLWRKLNSTIAFQAARQKLLDPVNDILYTYAARDKVLQDIKDLKDQVKSFSFAAINYANAKNQLERLELEFHEHMPDVCPLCGK